MVTNAFDNSRGSGIPDSKTLTGDTSKITLPRNCPVENSVADNNVVFRYEGAFRARVNDDLATG